MQESFAVRLARAFGRCAACAAVLTGAEFLLLFVLTGGQAAARPIHFFFWLPCAAALAFRRGARKSC